MEEGTSNGPKWVERVNPGLVMLFQEGIAFWRGSKGEGLISPGQMKFLEVVVVEGAMVAKIPCRDFPLQLILPQPLHYFQLHCRSQ